MSTLQYSPSNTPAQHFDWAAFAPEKIAYFSDLHLETSSFSLDPKQDADLIVLCGDIYTKGRAVAFAKTLNRPCIVILGNHDYWGDSLGHALVKCKKEAEGSLVKVLDNDVLQLKNLRILGCTLWTNYQLTGDMSHSIRKAEGKLYDPYAEGMLDHTKIRTPSYRKVRANDLARLHSISRQFLEHAFQEPSDTPTLVLTHHAPTLAALYGPDAKPDPASLDPFDACYASDLESMMNPAFVQAWVHGHVHKARQYEKNGVIISCNPSGYKLENIDGYNPLAQLRTEDLWARFLKAKAALQTSPDSHRPPRMI